MGSIRDTRVSEASRKPRRSPSSDSEGERQRRRRREREARDDAHRNTHSDNYNSRDDYARPRQGTDRHEERSRRSRSPREDRISKRSHDDHSRGEDSRPRRIRDDDARISGTRRREEERQAAPRNRGPLPSQEASFQHERDPTKPLVPEEEKQKPSLAPTGLLAKASNTVNQADGSAIVLKYHEPPEARKPPAKDQWKLFIFRGADVLETVDLSLRSCWLVGREVAIVDMAAEHPSISKQHAVVQFRYIEKRNEYGDKLGKVKPYLIDLESANGTKLNGETIEAGRYVELREKDMFQFGDSTREYVLMLSR